MNPSLSCIITTSGHEPPPCTNYYTQKHPSVDSSYLPKKYIFLHLQVSVYFFPWMLIQHIRWDLINITYTIKIDKYLPSSNMRSTSSTGSPSIVKIFFILFQEFINNIVYLLTNLLFGTFMWKWTRTHLSPLTSFEFNWKLLLHNHSLDTSHYLLVSPPDYSLTIIILRIYYLWYHYGSHPDLCLDILCLPHILRNCDHR